MSWPAFAGTLMGVDGLADMVNGTVVLTGAAEEVEAALMPPYVPTTEFAPSGSAVVVKVAVPPDTVPLPKAVVDPLIVEAYGSSGRRGRHGGREGYAVPKRG